METSQKFPFGTNATVLRCLMTCAVGFVVTAGSHRVEAQATESVVATAQDAAASQGDDVSPIAALRSFLGKHDITDESLSDQAFLDSELTVGQAKRAQEMVWESYRDVIRKERAEEVKNLEITIGDLKMPFFLKTFGKKPRAGHSLYISMHGGGGAPARVNDQQWENQKRLYQLKEGIYCVPRAPTNTWNLWHQAHIDQFFDRLITDLIVLNGVNPERVYIMGYSAGGDGVYQLAPRFADRLAAAAMMAGHPNETSPLGLRNIGFALQVGGQDSAYNRNKIARDWKTKLSDLQEADPKGYQHFVKVHEGKGHWMNLEDAIAVPWMARLQRNRFPERVVWKQDDVTHGRFYWLQMSDSDRKGRPEVVAERDGQTIRIVKSDVDELTILLNDEMAKLDRPVKVVQGNEVLFDGEVRRTLRDIVRTTIDRGDPGMVFSASIPVELKTAAEAAAE